MNPHKPHLNLVTALACEAKPIIDKLRLDKILHRPFSLYETEQSDMTISVLICGIGAIEVSTAIGWLAGRQAETNAAWLNVGVAGHADHKLGTLLRLVCVRQAELQNNFYPPLVAKFAGEVSAGLSSSSPNLEYPSGYALDMEAATFFDVAKKFANVECIQSLKIVSDNPESPIEQLNSMVISELIAPNVERIIRFGKDLSALTLLPKQTFGIPQELKDLHATVSQLNQLEEACRRITAAGLGTKNLQEDLKHCESVQEGINLMNLVTLKTPPALTSGLIDSLEGD